MDSFFVLLDCNLNKERVNTQARFLLKYSQAIQSKRPKYFIKLLFLF